MTSLSFGRAAVAGLGGTAAMTVLMLVAPTMGMPPMPIGEMLGRFLGIGTAAGWGMHFVIGLVLAAIYAAAVSGRVPGAPALGGALYGVAVFMVFQVVVTPLMGGPVFSGGNLLMIGGSLLGHLVYGGTVGAIYGAPRAVPGAVT